MEMLIYKLPLIVIVASPKWHSSLGNFKYAVILDPLPTGHVTQRMRSKLLGLNLGKCKFEVLYMTIFKLYGKNKLRPSANPKPLNRSSPNLNGVIKLWTLTIEKNWAQFA